MSSVHIPSLFKTKSINECKDSGVFPLTKQFTAPALSNSQRHSTLSKVKKLSLNILGRNKSESRIQRNSTQTATYTDILFSEPMTIQTKVTSDSNLSSVTSSSTYEESEEEATTPTTPSMNSSLPSIFFVDRQVTPAAVNQNYTENLANYTTFSSSETHVLKQFKCVLPSVYDEYIEKDDGDNISINSETTQHSTVPVNLEACPIISLVRSELQFAFEEADIEFENEIEDSRLELEQLLYASPRFTF